MYSDKVMKEFQNPKNLGKINKPDAVGEVGNPICGDMMKVYLKVEKGKIKDIKVETFGCVSAIATASKATEMVKGKTLEEAEKLSDKEVAAALGGLPPIKMHCSMLAVEAIRKAVKDYREKHGGKNEKIKTKNKNKKKK